MIRKGGTSETLRKKIVALITIEVHSKDIIDVL